MDFFRTFESVYLVHHCWSCNTIVKGKKRKIMNLKDFNKSVYGRFKDFYEDVGVIEDKHAKIL